jgi:hypothetical protein
MIKTTYICDLCKKESIDIPMEKVFFSIGKNAEYQLQGKISREICDLCLSKFGVFKIGKTTPPSAMDELFNAIVEEVKQNF